MAYTDQSVVSVSNFFVHGISHGAMNTVIKWDDRNHAYTLVGGWMCGWVFANDFSKDIRST